MLERHMARQPLQPRKEVKCQRCGYGTKQPQIIDCDEGGAGYEKFEVFDVEVEMEPRFRARKVEDEQ